MPSLFFPLPLHIPLRLSCPHHIAEPPTSYATLECPPCDSLPRSGVLATVLLALSSSLSLALTFHAVDDRRAGERRQASRIRFSQLRLRSVGSERRSEEFTSMRRAALPASRM